MAEPSGSEGRVTIVAGEGDEAGIAHVRLSRPDKLNAIDREMFAALAGAGETLRDMKGLRAVVLAGEGRAFCAGLDMASFAGWAAGGAVDIEERTHGIANLFQQAALVWRDLPVPVIAAIHGHCLGGGLQIACGADIRVVAPDARLSIMEMKWGIVPDMAGFALWRGLVRDDVLRELVYTAREFSGEEARDLGFATMLDAQPLLRATAIARAIAGKSPDAVRAAKRLANAMHDLSLPEILTEESRAQQALLLSKNQIEAVKSQMEGRPARFGDI